MGLGLTFASTPNSSATAVPSAIPSPASSNHEVKAWIAAGIVLLVLLSIIAVVVFTFLQDLFGARRMPTHWHGARPPETPLALQLALRFGGPRGQSNAAAFSSIPYRAITASSLGDFDPEETRRAQNESIAFAQAQGLMPGDLSECKDLPSADSVRHLPHPEAKHAALPHPAAGTGLSLSP